MLQKLFILVIPLLCIQCTPRPWGDTTVSFPKECSVVAGENLVFPNQAPIDSIHLDTINKTQCYNAENALAEAKRIACTKGYTGASLVNIKPPMTSSFFPTHWCYSTQVLFYKDSSQYYHAEHPIIDSLDIINRSVNIGLDIFFGGVAHGSQIHSPIPQSNSEASVGTFSAGISALYYITPTIGFGLRIDHTYTEKDHIGLYVKNNQDALFEYIFSNQYASRGVAQFYVRSGLSYSSLSYHKEQLSEVQTFNTTLNESTAKGFGLHSEIGVRIILLSYFYMEVSTGYRYEMHWFPDASDPIDGGTLDMHVGIGYRL